MYKFKKTKYGNKRNEYQGNVYDSKMEKDYAEGLEIKKLAGEIKEWKRSHAWQLYVNEQKICQYTIDFRVETSEGKIQYIEIKGAKDYAFTIRWKLVQALFDELTEGENAELYLNKKLEKTSYQ